MYTTLQCSLFSNRNYTKHNTFIYHAKLAIEFFLWTVIHSIDTMLSRNKHLHLDYNITYRHKTVENL